MLKLNEIMTNAALDDVTATPPWIWGRPAPHYELEQKQHSCYNTRNTQARMHDVWCVFAVKAMHHHHHH